MKSAREKELLEIIAQRDQQIALLQQKIDLLVRKVFGASSEKLDGSHDRSVYTANDGGKWKFGQSGEPYPFEEVEAYSVKRVSNRFTPEMLGRYLGHLGVRPFDENWYLSPAWKVQKTGKLPASLREY